MNVRRVTMAALAALCALTGLLALGGAPALARLEYVPAGAFAGAGSGAGQLSEPEGVAVNDSTELVPGAGDVYVVDKGNGRVERFSAAGAYLGQFDGSGTYEVEGKAEKGTAAPTGKLSSPTLIAVDDSGKTTIEDPSVGDVYVVDAGHKVIDKFGPGGEYISQIKEGEAGVALGDVLGVAVDSSGDVWALQSYERRARPSAETSEFSDTGSFMTRGFGVENTAPDGLAIDSSGNAYVVGRDCCGPHPSEEALMRREVSGETREIAVVEAGTFAIDSSSHNVIVDKVNSLEMYGPFGEPPFEPLQTLVSESLQESHGIAVNGTSGVAYATLRGAGEVAVFDYVLLPTVSTAAAAPIGETGATLNGTIETEGEPATECRFEYGAETSYGESVPCQQSPAEIDALSKGGTAPVKVSATVSALQPRTTYDFRLDTADGNGAAHGGNESFYTVGRPAVEDEQATSIGATEATVTARLGPGGASTGYYVEYGEGDVEELATSEVSAGAGQGTVNVAVRLANLQSSTGYRFRFVASNGLGRTDGGEATFATTGTQITGTPTQSSCPNRTFSGFNAALPDCRAYELVSIPIDETYVPEYGETLGEGGTGEDVGLPGGFRAAPTGEGVAYMGGESNSGVGGNGATGDGDGNQYLAARGTNGWQAGDISIPINPNYNAEFREFSPDLETQVVLAGSPPGELLSAQPPLLTDCASKEATGIYSRNVTGLHALVTENQGSGECGGGAGGISADDSHILFQSGGPFTAQAKPGSFAEPNLYDSVGGVVHQVNILPDGEPEQTPFATFGSRVGETSEYSPHSAYGGDISSDGSRIFWTALEGSQSQPQAKALYVRENDAQPQSPVLGGRCTTPADACTMQVDAAEAGAPGPGGGGLFWTSADDGSKVFFTDQNRLTKDATAAPGEPDLYEYEINAETGAPGTLVDLSVDTNTGEHANVQGLAGTSEDGSYVYFVADGALAGRNAEGKVPVAGQPNLYLAHDNVTTFVVTLASSDNTVIRAGGDDIGDWQLQPGSRSAEVTPGGSAIGFESRLELTGYDNYGIVGYEYEHGKPVLSRPSYAAIPEIFVYDADSRRILCASCNPTGAPPAPYGTNPLATTLEGAIVSVSGAASFMPRWIAEREGTQVYFMTAQPLVANDSNDMQDVYEWQSDGSGGCGLDAGCLKLISSAEPLSNAYFIDSAANGRDVFFTSRSLLTGNASGETLKLYDARVGGGRAEPSLACTGTGCQGVPPAPPIFATPSSVTFNGVGNFEPGSAPVKAKAKPKQKLKRKKHARCKQGFHKQHNRCVRGTRKAKRSVKPSRGGGK